MDEKHLFVVAVNNSGSTLLNGALARCRNAVALPDEGQKAPNIEKYMPTAPALGIRGIWTEARSILENPANYDWPAIRAIWNEQWRQHPNYATAQPRVLVEKTPANVLRADLLQEQFPNAAFLVVVRNPYAVAEGIRRRMGFELDRCIRHWIRSARHQMENLRVLRQHVFFTYEEMCDHPELVCRKVKGLVPALDDFSLEGTHVIHSILPDGPHPLQNLNRIQIQRLRPEERVYLTAELEKNMDVLRFFGYTLLSSPQDIHGPRLFPPGGRPGL